MALGGVPTRVSIPPNDAPKAGGRRRRLRPLPASRATETTSGAITIVVPVLL